MGRFVPTSYTHKCNNGVKLGVPQAILVANGGGEVEIGNQFCPDARAYFGAFSQQIITPYFLKKTCFGCPCQPEEI
jgi:hypothetical protein